MIFDVLHLDGRAVRVLPYSERRELLAGLALRGEHWRTPQCFSGNDAAGLLDATAARCLEGVVAKRLSSSWLPGRRSAAWLKQKHRRRETFAVTGRRDARGSEPESFFLARETDGRLRWAGSAAFGLGAAERQQLRARLAEGAPARVVVDFHGRPRGPVRDPVMRELVG